MRLVVLGDPVEHSLSPLLHTTALRSCGLPGSYVVRRVDATGMKAAVDELRTGALDGANVTMPHKRLAHDLSDRVAADAQRTGAVNTLVRIGEEVIGHNTDVGGVRNAWQWGGLPVEGPVTLYGAGGAAAAALVALEGRDVIVCARRAERAGELTEAVGLGRAAEWGPPLPGSVIVNATPIGMEGESFPTDWLSAAAGVLDMVYRSASTPLAEDAQRTGLPVATGRDMLLGQAIDSFWLWTGRPAPVAAMRTALRNAVNA